MPQLLYPFPYHEFNEYLKTVDNVIVMELSYSAQFYKYLQTFLHLPEATDLRLQTVRRQEPDGR